MESWESVSSARTALVFEGPSATARLLQLGLNEEDFIVAVQAAEMERRNCSPLEPTIAPGFKAWAAGFRTLAERLMPRGWERVESKGLPRMLNPETAVAIAIVNGDEATGHSDGAEPKSKTPRGVQSVFLVRSNEIQLSLPFAEGRRFQPLPADQEQITWWLLMHSGANDSLHAELALPVGLGEDGRLSVWQERIIIDIPDFTWPQGGREDEEPPLEVSVDIRPRS
jgi:hypothetical protein